MRFSVLASGSGGNACYVETARSRVLIDAGLSCRELMRRLALIDINPRDLDALILTHEHLDHIKGAGPLARRFNLPVYANRSTLRKGIKVIGNLSKPVTVHTGQTIAINGLLIETFTKCHDAADPMGVVVSYEGVKLGLITDLGRSTSVVEDRLRGCRALIIESNHDEKMLEEGPYPLDLKRRIKGAEGHLSNLQAAELLEALAHEALHVVVLAHLSAKNNLPDMALRAAKECLLRCGCLRTRVYMSSQDSPAPMIELV
ncbi:MAG: MBL fold metallo-hydrolase [Proteobacteria bacterium]|nr:MBL fold metallo-hydrolase [Pseudomonadota bacterium]